MKKAKVAVPSSSLARTPKDAMAPKHDMPEASEEDKVRSGEYDLDHLLRAEDIKQDAKKMEYVHKAHKKKMTSMRSIADLKMAAQALAHQKKEADEGEDEGGEMKEEAKSRVKTRFPKT